MNKSIITILLILTSFLFSFCEAGASIELREFYQDGSNYIITVYANHGPLEFFWKGQEANQGAYQQIGTLQSPNYGNLYQIKWDITSLADGNYTILIRSTETELEQNVSINKAHWEISPIQLQYLGSVTARYKGDIEGTVDVHPSGGTLAPYSQYFIFDKQDEQTFRITSLQIQESVLNSIFLELYSHGSKWGTLHYRINDDILEVRVIFPSFADYRPGGSQDTGTTEPESEPQQPSQDLLDKLSEISQKLDQVNTQNTNLTQEIANLRDDIAQKDGRIKELENQLQTKDREKEKIEEEAENNLFLYVIAAGAGAGIVYVILSRTSNIPSASQRQPRKEFLGGRPYEERRTYRTEEGNKIPACVYMAAQEHNYNLLNLWQAVEDRKTQDPNLTTEQALNIILNEQVSENGT